jgi:hypothetical protein
MSNENKSTSKTAGASPVAHRRLVRPLVKYLHTIHACPGDYNGYQIVYAIPSRPIHLVASLPQIRKEQKLSIKHRTADGFQTDPKQYGYKRVYVA